jgi:ribosomal protein S18 acetylase RimI-like enzyme
MGVLTHGLARSAQPIRPFSLARDLPGLADLVEICFEADLERTGSQIVSEMREMASWGLTLRLLALLGPPYRGLVWEEEGRLVGNVTLMRECAGAWSLSNIAVTPEARGRGIGGALVDAAIRRLRGVGANTVMLQVRPENALAVGLYERQGFVTYDRVHEMVLKADSWAALSPEPQRLTVVRPARRDDLAGILAVLSEGMPESARQVDPVNATEWQQGTWRAARRALSMGFRGQERIVLVGLIDGLVSGVAWATVRMFGSSHDVGIVASSSAQCTVERPLLRALLEDLDGQPRRDLRAVVSAYQPGVLSALGDAGFAPLRVLDRMALKL